MENLRREGLKEYLMLGMVAVILALAIMQSFQIKAIKAGQNAPVISGAATGSVDMTGWTADEKMMYEHHGTLPARVQGGSAPAASGSGMVGGC